MKHVHFFVWKLVFLFIFVWNTTCIATIPIESLSGNQQSTAEYLNTVTNNSALILQINQLSSLSTSQLQSALNTISPSRLGSTAFATDNTYSEFNQIVTNRIQMHRFQSDTMMKNLSVAYESYEKEDLLALNDSDQVVFRNPQKSDKRQNPYALWIAGFGQVAHEDAQNQDPDFDIRTGGFFLGFDYLDIESFYLGGGFGYSDTETCQDHGSSIDYFIASFYSTYSQKHFFLESNISGSYNSYRNRRCIFYPGFMGVANSKHEGFQLAPHIGFSYDFLFSWGTLEPYVSIDWVYLFENSYSESGAAPFNMNVKSRNSFLLRSEMALQSYQVLQVSHGVFSFKEFVSYVNKKPYNVGTIQSFLTGAVGDLTVSSLNEIQNLFRAGIEVFYRGKKDLFISFETSGEFGSDYSMAEVQGKVGKYF